MNIMFNFLLFMVLFNISAVAIASTEFFGECTLYGDIVGREPGDIIEDLWHDPVDDNLPGFGINLPMFGEVAIFSWATLTASILIVSVAIGAITKSTPTVIPAGIVGTVFLLMYTNSKNTFEAIIGNQGEFALYIGAMIGVGFFFMALIVIMDYLSGQRKSG